MERGGWEPALPAGARDVGEATARRRAAGHRGGPRRDADRPARPGDRALLRWASVLGASFSGALSRGARGRSDRRRPAPRHGTGSPSSSSAIPTCRAPSVPPRADPRRGLRGALLQARRECTDVSQTSSKRTRGPARTSPQSSSRSTTTVLGTPPSRGGTRSRPGNGREQNGPIQRPSSSTVGRSTWPRPGRPCLLPIQIARGLAGARRLPAPRRPATSDAAEAYAAARDLMPKRHARARRADAPSEGLLREDMGRYPDALRWFTRALKATEAIPDEDARRRLRIRLRLALAQTRYRAGSIHGLHPTVQGGRPGVP